MITFTLDESLRPQGAGEALVFDDTKDRIVVGRSPDCDVPLNPDLTRLGRHHFEIRRAAGGMELVTDREHPVFVDGQRVVGARALLGTEELRLLDPMTGPVIKVIYAKTQTGLETEKDALQDAGTLQDKVGGIGKGLKHLAAAVAVLALGFGGYTGFGEWQRGQAEQAVLLQMHNLNARMTASEQLRMDWVEVHQRVKPSVYQVTFSPASGGPPIHQGTAWAIGPSKLATNAHVARLFNNPKLQGRLLLVPAANGLSALPVLDVQLHPAYMAYRKTAAETRREGEKPPLATLGSYDVALLSVDEAAGLVPLSLAQSSVQPGDAVAYLGYPERCAIHASQLHIKTGIVSAVSDFLGTPAGNELIYHTAPGTGGASGSPLLNSKGEVVGVFSGGESAQPVAAVAAAAAEASAPAAPTCAASGAATLYAQNVSLLREMQDGVAEEKQAARLLQWKNSALYKLNQDRVWGAVAAVAEASTPEDSGYDAEGAVVRLNPDEAAKSARGAAAHTFRGKPRGEYAAFADVPPDAGVTLMAYVNGTPVQVPIQVEGRPTAVFALNQTSDVVVTLSGPSAQDAKVVLVRIDEEASAQQ